MRDAGVQQQGCLCLVLKLIEYSKVKNVLIPMPAYSWTFIIGVNFSGYNPVR